MKIYTSRKHPGECRWKNVLDEISGTQFSGNNWEGKFGGDWGTFTGKISGRKCPGENVREEEMSGTGKMSGRKCPGENFREKMLVSLVGYWKIVNEYIFLN